MTSRSGPATGERTVAVWWVEIAVAGALALVGVLVVADSYRIGIGWGAEGPQAGFFPFYVGLILTGAASVTLARNLRPTRRDGENFVEWSGLGRVLAVLVPAIVFVILVGWIGLYVAAALLIAFFMRLHGGYPLALSAGVAVAIVLLVFAVFEIWFLMPLPKGPLEAAFGF